MKKRIKDYIKLPSEAVQLMIDGLREQSKRPDFKIKMNTYGCFNGDICFGCAATCALQKMTGINFTWDNILTTPARSEAVSIPQIEVNDFEVAIDWLRLGQVYYFAGEICKLLELDGDFPDPEDDWSLTDENWESELPKVEAYVKLLQSHGL